MIGRRLLRLGLLLSIGLLQSNAWAHGNAPPEERTSRFIEFPDIDGAETLVVDLHTHSVFSDGHVWPNIRVAEALKDGLDAYAVTEHLEFQPHKGDIPHPDRDRAFQEAVDAAEATDLIVIQGSEITREEPAGHINAVFVTDSNALLNVEWPKSNDEVDPEFDMIEYYRAANAWPSENPVTIASEQGAFLFWNHPFWSRGAPDGIARITDFHVKMIDGGHLHGIEIANGDAYSEEAHAIALEHDIALIGVSDVHELIDWDYTPHEGGHRPVTLVFAEARTADALKAALFAKRTVVWWKNTLIGREAELMPLLAASLKAEATGYLPQSEVATVRFTNTSDARFILRNLGEQTFMTGADVLEVPPHGTLEIGVKRPEGGEIDLRMEVLNALLAPRVHPTLRFTVTPPENAGSQG